MNTLVRKFGAAVLGLAAGLAVVPSASAAIVSKSWDPALPSEFGGLGWTATINFSIPQGCLDSTGFKLILGNSTFFCGSSQPAISVLTAQVGFYDTSDILVDVLTFTPGVSSLNLLGITLSMGGDPTFFLTWNPSNALNGAAGDPANPPSPLADYDFRLTLNGSAPGLQYRVAQPKGAWQTSKEPPTDTATTVFSDEELNNTCDVDCVVEKTSLKVGAPVFTAVPEPDSLPLALLALTGVWALRRRA